MCSPALGDESFGIVLLEAMAARTADRRHENRRLRGVARRHRQARGWSRPTIRTALAREIAALLDDPGRARTLGERGAAFAREYDWGTIARRLESIYLAASDGVTSGQNEYGS